MADNIRDIQAYRHIRRRRKAMYNLYLLIPWLVTLAVLLFYGSVAYIIFHFVMKLW